MNRNEKLEHDQLSASISSTNSDTHLIQQQRLSLPPPPPSNHLTATTSSHSTSKLKIRNINSGSLPADSLIPNEQSPTANNNVNNNNTSNSKSSQINTNNRVASVPG